MVPRISSKLIQDKCALFASQVLRMLSLPLVDICVYAKTVRNLMKNLGIAAQFAENNSFHLLSTLE